MMTSANTDDYSIAQGRQFYYLGALISIIHADHKAVYYANIDTDERHTMSREDFESALVRKDIGNAWHKSNGSSSEPPALEWLSDEALEVIRFRRPYAQHFATHCITGNKNEAHKIIERIAKDAGHPEDRIPAVSTVRRWAQHYRQSQHRLESLQDRRRRVTDKRLRP